MLIVMKPNASAAEVAAVMDRVRSLGFKPHEIAGANRVAIGITGNPGAVPEEEFARLAGIAQVIRVTQPFKLVSREVQPHDTIVDVSGEPVGGGAFTFIAGPCAVESRDQVFGVADRLAALGVKFLRGGAYKPRTSPYAFQGLREEGLKILAETRERTGMRVVTEVKDTETLPLVEEYADVLQIGARNMQNFSLLEAAGRAKKPVLLKRGLSATLQELLMAAEYVMSGGNKGVILCERGIRTFETMTRNTLDLGAVPVLRRVTHLPVLIDPSHGIGIADAVPPLARAAAAVGADGVLVEVHPNPDRALSDGMQSLRPEAFEELYRETKAIAELLGRRVN